MLRKLSLCYSIMYHYNVCTMMRAVLTGRSTGLDFVFAWFCSLSCEHLIGFHGVICI